MKKKILAIIPARAGSKGIKKKNLKKINGLTLIEHAILCLKKVKMIDHIHISTDGKDIFSHALKNNLDPLFYRPKNLSGDKISDYQVVKFVLKKLEKVLNTTFETVLLIQPTSPNRTSLDIKRCINLLNSKNASAVWTLSESDLKFHPYKQMKIINSKVNFYHKYGNKIIARQQLQKSYVRNGICYAIKRKTIIKNKNLIGNNCFPLIIKKKVANIDTIQDLEFASKLMRKY